MSKYLKRDCELGYITDHSEIEFQKLNNLRHSVQDFMLGDFDENGIYCLEEGVRAELLAMRKYVVETVENIDIIVSELKLNEQITFTITYEEDSATLALIERIKFEGNNKNGTHKYSNINEYVLDRVITSGEIDKSLLYARWNISTDEGRVLGFADMGDEMKAQYLNLSKRFKYLMAGNITLLKHHDKLEEIDAIYLNALFDAVSHDKILQDLVDKELKNTLKQDHEFVRLDEPFAMRTMLDVVNDVIANNIDKLNEKSQKEFMDEVHTAQKEYNVRVADVLEVSSSVVGITDFNADDVGLLTDENEFNGSYVSNKSTMSVNTLDTLKTVEELSSLYLAQQEKVERQLKVGRLNRNSTSVREEFVTRLVDFDVIDLNNHVTVETKVEQQETVNLITKVAKEVKATKSEDNSSTKDSSKSVGQKGNGTKKPNKGAGKKAGGQTNTLNTNETAQTANKKDESSVFIGTGGHSQNEEKGEVLPANDKFESKSVQTSNAEKEMQEYLKTEEGKMSEAQIQKAVKTTLTVYENTNRTNNSMNTGINSEAIVGNVENSQELTEMESGL